MEKPWTNPFIDSDSTSHSLLLTSTQDSSSCDITSQDKYNLEREKNSKFFLSIVHLKIYFSWNPTFSLVFELTYGVRLKVSIFILCYSVRHMTCKLPVIGNCSTTVPNQHFSLQNYYSQDKIMYQDDVYQISSQMEQWGKCYG